MSDRPAAADDAFEDAYPLSPAQEGLLFHSLYAPDSGAYVSQLCVRIERLDAGRFVRAWRTVVARHPALRTAFVFRSTRQPLQVVVRELEVPVAREDWQALPAGEREERLTSYLAADAQRGFNPAKPPLMRLALVALAPGECLMVWTFHHLLLDGWSVSLVLSDLLAASRAPAEALPARPAPRPFRDFISWLAQRDTGDEERYWRRYLQGFTAPTTLAVDRGRQSNPAPGTAQYGRCDVRLSRAATAALETETRRHRLTLSTLQQGAWALLLARYSGDRDVAFGGVVAGRPHDLPGAAEIVGMFANTLPVRVRLRGDLPAVAWLQELQAKQLAAREHEHTPLARVQGWSELEPGLPLFDTLCACENFPLDEALRALGGSEIAPPRFVDRAHYPLTFVAFPGPELLLALEHGERCDRVTTARMLAQLANVLGALLAPGSRLAEISLLTRAERHQLLREWNDSARPLPAEACVHRLIAEQADRTPAAAAVAANGETLSYGELVERMWRLAARLRAAGVGPERTVGVLVERSHELAVGLLGTLAAGGVYLPLDPALPAERLGLLIAEAGPVVLLTVGHLRSRLAPYRVPTLCLDAAPAEPRTLDKSGPAPQPAAENLAYTVYTSGSTGGPKGASIPHRALVNFALEARRAFGLRADDRVLQFSPLGFNVVMEELIPTWLAGACVVLERGVEQLSCRDLERLIARHAITGLELPAPFWQEWVDELVESRSTPPACLRWVILGCEQPHPERVAAWRRFGIPVIQVFGLTETTVTSAVHRDSGATAAGPLELPAGRPIGNTRLYLLDQDLQPVARGVPGELYIGGDGVGRGYHRRPDLTAARFVPDLFAGAELGRRLYRTGDLARWLGDGSLQLLGRLDQQVKIRGFRVEPAEIEQVLGQHPWVQNAAVVARPSAQGRVRLAAYVVPAAAASAALAAGSLRPELLRFLERRLPAFMVPSELLVLDRLPLTTTGKLDRRALPEPAPRQVPAYRWAPASAVEAALLGIWSEVLGSRTIEGDDDFFALGGDSILSLQIVARAHRAGIRITPRQVFEHPTVARLASVAGVAAAVPAAAEPPAGDVPLTPIQRWFFALGLRSPQRWNLPLTLESRRALDVRLLRRALAAAFAHHDALRLRFIPDGSGWRQRHAEAGEALPLREIDLAVLPAAAQRRAIAAGLSQLQSGLDLARGPLCRAALFRRGAGGSGDRLALVFHHLIVDGVSLRILVEDLEAAYTLLAQRREVRLPARTASWASWAQALAAHAPSAAAELGYWLDETGGAEPAPAAAGGATVGTSTTLRVALDAERTAQLVHRVPPVYRTEINDVLLAALARGLADWTGGGPVLVDLEGHGREEISEAIDVSRTVGWFTSLYPVRLDPRQTVQPGEALKRVKEHLRRVPRRGLGYGLLRHLAPAGVEAAELARRPGAPVLFNYLGQTDALFGADAMFALVTDEEIAAVDPGERRSHRLEINAWIQGGRLQAAISFSEGLDRRDTVAALADRFVAALTALIDHCLSPGAGGATPSDFPLIDLGQEELDRLLGDRQDVEDVYPLAPLQQGMLFHSLLAPELGMYFSQLVVDLLGDLDVPALQRAWQTLVDRHPSLRVAFAWEGLDEPLQIVYRRLALRWRHEDWRSLSGALQEQRFADLLRDDQRRGVRLSVAPLLRVAVLRLAEDRHRMVWSYHQSLLDGWSLPILFRELGAFYRAFTRGDAVSIGPPRRYRDFVAWLRRQDAAAAEAFWRRELSGFTAPTSLAALVQPGGPGGGHATHAMRFHALSPEASSAVQTLARKRQLTLNTLVQGAWALLLSRYSGEGEVLFGATVAGRPPELEGVGAMVGLFINTLPSRVPVPARAELLPWLRELQERQLALRQFEHTPLVQIQAWSEVPAGSPLFETILVFENYPMETALAESGAGLGVVTHTTLSRTNYPLSLVADADPLLRLRLTWDARRFDGAAMARLLSHLGVLLAGFAADPAAALGDRSVLSAAERSQLLREWNDTASPAAGGCLHERFAAVAARQPESLALDDGEVRFTFGELDRWANRLAHRLRRDGVRPETVVGICLGRSSLAIAAMLAVQKAGGAHLPLDPAQPAPRLAHCLADAGARVVLTQARWLGRLPDGPAATLCLDRMQEQLRQEPEGCPASGVQPENLSYVLYTSGSTGEPKGVMVPHRAVANLLDALERAVYARHPQVRSVGLNAPLTFDSSVKQLIQLARGRTLHVLPELARHDLSALAGELARARLSALDCTPAQLQVWLAAQTLIGAPGLDLVLVGGEAIDPLTWNRLAAMERPAFYNLYGPTECTVDATACRIDAAVPGPRLGRPLANVRTHVLGPDLTALPIGALGELCVAGTGLARGYLGRPADTAARFVPDPFGEPGARLYRTGDRARRLADGTLESRGRYDRQLKVRGFRLEPGEIEAALLRHPAIRQALVAAREGPAGEASLCAYLVPHPPARLDVAQVREELRRRLPAHAVPGWFVIVERIPLTAHGKPDLRALAAAALAAGERRTSYVGPRTPFEAELAAIWGDVLGREVGVDDDFFDLGGHSLIATRMISRIRSHFEVDLPLADFFAHPTVARLAVVIAQLRTARAGQDASGAIDAVLADLERLSDEEARALL